MCEKGRWMQDEVTLVDCVSCGAPNHPARTNCGRCRALLTTRVVDGPHDETSAMARVGATQIPPEQDTPPVGARARSESTASARVVDLLRGTAPGDTQPLDPVVPDTIEVRPLTARPVLLVTVVGLALGVVVGLVAAIGGATAPQGAPVPETVAFDPTLYDGAAAALAVSSVTATSFLPATGENRYEPELVLDQNPTTAWNSDGSVRADGVGEVLTLRLQEPAWVTALEIANGYQKDDVRFLANARIARAAVVFDDGTRVSVVLLDQTGLQRVPLPSAMLTTTVRIEVVEVYSGDTYEDLAVSEFTVFGHEAVGADRTTAEERAEAVALQR